MGAVAEGRKDTSLGQGAGRAGVPEEALTLRGELPGFQLRHKWGRRQMRPMRHKKAPQGWELGSFWGSGLKREEKEWREDSFFSVSGTGLCSQEFIF